MNARILKTSENKQANVSKCAYVHTQIHTYTFLWESTNFLNPLDPGQCWYVINLLEAMAFVVCTFMLYICLHTVFTYWTNLPNTNVLYKYFKFTVSHMQNSAWNPFQALLLSAFRALNSGMITNRTPSTSTLTSPCIGCTKCLLCVQLLETKQQATLCNCWPAVTQWESLGLTESSR